jgi:primary-amine oxidase
MTALHPFDPITPAEIQLAVKILEAAFPGVSLRYKKIDVNEPLKREVVPYIEAERLGKPLPTAPTRLFQVLFHRLDNGAFYKALLNAGTRSVVYAKQLPKEVQVYSMSIDEPSCNVSDSSRAQSMPTN